MKKIALIFIILLFAAVAHATPYLVCDPQDGVTEYEIVDNVILFSRLTRKPMAH